MTYFDAPYDSPAKPHTPGELVVARVALIATAVLTALLIATYPLTAKVTAQFLGAEIGINAFNLAGGVIACFLRPGRGWMRWAIIVVCAVRCVTITTYYVLPGGPTYAPFLVFPVIIIVAVNLPAARAYFTGADAS